MRTVSMAMTVRVGRRNGRDNSGFREKNVTKSDLVKLVSRGA